jgi:hypothetical protein
MSRHLPRYPIYIISKGRADRCLSMKLLDRHRVDYRVVVEPQEEDAYADAVGRERLLVLPFSNLGLGSIPARNWVWEHSLEAGDVRHWIMDDNIRNFRRSYRGERIPCDAGPAFAVAEDFSDRYTNVALTGFQYQSFGFKNRPVVSRNVHVYSCTLIRNELPFRWRGRYNEDTDLCLQALSHGLCTVSVNLFLIDKATTMSMRGGNTDELYAGDGRLHMARALERLWPGVVRVGRRYGRPQHVVDWARFDTPLELRDDVDLASFKPNEYGYDLSVVRPEKVAGLEPMRERYDEATREARV